MHLSLYLSFLLGKQTISAASIGHAALKWVHGILPLQQNPLDADIQLFQLRLSPLISVVVPKKREKVEYEGERLIGKD